MSCRVLGRRLEEGILQYLVEQARLRAISAITGRYIRTAKNGLVRYHFSRLGFVQVGTREDGGCSLLALRRHFPFHGP
ncbi:hypothetical protein BST65_09660 [Bradyrhizobium canariense]|nr:hypothetical protein BST65_09660 [Bradyrhizobium canariense]OSI37371.1 hypothetical protein BST66_03425 [Bradyrhizobium canariense]OSI59497.1 hypothetical protein BSZ15_04375 [Bradyrhizobium canariense]